MQDARDSAVGAETRDFFFSFVFFLSMTSTVRFSNQTVRSRPRVPYGVAPNATPFLFRVFFCRPLDRSELFDFVGGAGDDVTKPAGPSLQVAANELDPRRLWIKLNPTRDNWIPHFYSIAN